MLIGERRDQPTYAPRFRFWKIALSASGLGIFVGLYPYRLLARRNVHKGQSHPGEHPPIIDEPLWKAVQEQLASNAFATAKPDARLIKLLIRAHRFNSTLIGSAGVPFAAVAKQEA